METCDLAATLQLGADTAGLNPLAPVLEGIAAETLHCSLRPTATAGEAFQAIALSCLCRFKRSESELARTADPEALHQARVALRQLRTALSIFRPICEDERFGHFQSELRRLAASTNEARDLDAVIARMAEAPASLATARKLAGVRAGKALAAPRARRLVRELVDWLADGVWLEVRNPTGLTAAEFAPEALDRLHRKLMTKGRNLRALDDQRLHAVRIVAKKLRYATDFFVDLFPADKARRRAKKFNKAIRALQDELGTLRDCMVAPSVLGSRHVPRAAWPALPERAQLVERAATALEHLFACKRFWR